MSWNNRIFRHGTAGQFALHEAYYNTAGKVWCWTEEPMTKLYDSVDELIDDLKQMLNDAERSKEDVLNFDDPPEGKADFDI